MSKIDDEYRIAGGCMLAAGVVALVVLAPFLFWLVRICWTLYVEGFPPGEFE